MPEGMARHVERVDLVDSLLEPEKVASVDMRVTIQLQFSPRLLIPWMRFEMDVLDMAGNVLENRQSWRDGAGKPQERLKCIENLRMFVRTAFS